MERREPPTTAEGWYVLHDLRWVDWDAWRGAPERERRQALADGVEYLRAHENLEDAEDGGSAVFSVFGHGADLLVVHMRPTTADIDLVERRFERTALAGYTDRTASYFSVTEVSGYTTDALGEEGIGSVEDEGLARYLRSRLYPDIPEVGHVCFYPMDKRRGPHDNWYDLSFDERAELMRSHADIGREYAGDVTQIITGSVGLDDYEWGVTLLADDPTAIKHLLYEMRFDPSSSRFVDFGPFYFGRRFPPEDLDALLAGDPVPSDTGHTEESTHGTPDESKSDSVVTTTVSDEERAGDVRPTDGPPADGETLHESVDEEVVRRELRGLGLRIDDHPEAGYGLVFPSSADAENLVGDVEEVRGNFEHYETHVLTTVRAEAGQSAVVSLWSNQRAADIASGFLADLSGVEPGIGGPVDTGSGDGRDGDGSSAPPEDDSEDGRAGGPAAGDGGTSGSAGADFAAERGGAAGDDDGDRAAGPLESLREELAEQGIYAGQPHGQDVYAMVVYSEADVGDIADALAPLHEQFDGDDSHVSTAVYRTVGRDGPSAVASLWESQDAAVGAGEHLVDLPGVVGRPDEGDSFETLGLFYTVTPEFRADFRERFEAVGDLLADMEGHRETDLLVNRADENDMFIASRWRSKADALEFFRSEAFRETVQWGREVLADRPRHVFLT